MSPTPGALEKPILSVTALTATLSTGRHSSTPSGFVQPIHRPAPQRAPEVAAFTTDAVDAAAAVSPSPSDSPPITALSRNPSAPCTAGVPPTAGTPVGARFSVRLSAPER